MLTLKGGGDDFWTVYLTGITRNQIANLDPASMSSAAASKTSSATAGPSTVVVTAGPSSGSSKHGSNTVAIAVGVVVGLVGLAAIVGGAFLWLRHQRRREAESEFKRQAAISSFVEGGQKPPYSGSNDSRLDPSVLAARRISDGSIADNADYSRRILQVSNPDGVDRY
jgi:cell wall integrity and stress response component